MRIQCAFNAQCGQAFSEIHTNVFTIMYWNKLKLLKYPNLATLITWKCSYMYVALVVSSKEMLMVSSHLRSELHPPPPNTSWPSKAVRGLIFYSSRWKWIHPVLQNWPTNNWQGNVQPTTVFAVTNKTFRWNQRNYLCPHGNLVTYRLLRLSVSKLLPLNQKVVSQPTFLKLLMNSKP